MANEVKIEITLDEKQALKALGRFQKEVDKSASGTTKAFKKIDMAVASFAGNLTADLANKAIGAFTGAVNDAFRQLVDFEKAVAEVNTLLPESKQLTAELTRELVGLSGQFGTEKAEQAKALYQIISSGAAEGAEANKLLRSANELAIGGLSNLTDTVNILTDIINIYGSDTISAADASNILFKTVREGKTTIQELSTNIGAVLPTAQRLGVSLEEVGAALATLTTQGLSTSERVTQLNALFTALFRKSGDAGKEFGKEVGDAFSIAAFRTKRLEQFLIDLEKATGGNEETLQKLLGSTEAVKAVFGLTGTAAESLTKKMKALKDESNALTQAVEKNTATFSFQFAAATQKTSNILGVFLNRRLKPVVEGLKVFNNALTKETDDERFKRLSDDAAELNKKINFLNNKLFLSPDGMVQLAKAKEELQKIQTELQGLAGTSLIDLNRIASRSLSDEDPEPPKPDPRVIEFRKHQNKTLLALEKERIAAEDELAKLQYEAMKENRTLDLEERQQEYELEKEIKLLQDEEKIAQEAKTKEALAELDMKFKGEQLKRDLEANKKKEKADKKAAEKKKKLDEQAKQAYFATKQAEINIAANAAGLITAVSGKETKAAFLISKAAAAAQVVIDTQVANMLAARQLGAYAPPVIAKQTIAGAIALGTIAATTLQGFADGGVVGGGATTGGDNRTITARDGEMILNADQQASLFNGINSGGMGGDIVIEIDGREIARAVRDQRQQGFSV